MPSPIEHVVVLMLENRSFDHIFGFRQGVEGLRGNETNRLDPDNPHSPEFRVGTNAPFAVSDREGPSHSFNGVNIQVYGDRRGPASARPAANEGFVMDYREDLLRRLRQPSAQMIGEVMQSFTREQLRSIYHLAEEFCLFDQWHCEVPGPTMPNRFYIHAATSAGYVHNAFQKPFFGTRTIYHSLQEAGRTWATYFHDLSEVLQFFPPAQRSPQNFRRFQEQFAADVAADRLPNYAFILPRFLNQHHGPRANSQHAPEDVRFGDNLIADVYDALRSHAAVWNKSALIVTYDEHGGFYDHVVPPSEGIPNPDGLNSPQLDDPANFTPPSFAFDRLGLRVPTLIASPWVARGSVVRERYQHTSILATVKEIFNLPHFLTRRDASARPFTSLFTALQSPRTDTPQKLERTALPQEAVAFAAGMPVDAGDEPLDTLQQEMLEGFFAMINVRGVLSKVLGARAVAQPDVEPILQTTQGDAAELIDQLLTQQGL
jgi:phospholipase C